MWRHHRGLSHWCQWIADLYFTGLDFQWLVCLKLWLLSTERLDSAPLRSSGRSPQRRQAPGREWRPDNGSNDQRENSTLVETLISASYRLASSLDGGSSAQRMKDCLRLGRIEPWLSWVENIFETNAVTSFWIYPMPQAADNFSRLQSLMVILMNTSKFKSRNLKLLIKRFTFGCMHFTSLKFTRLQLLITSGRGNQW